MAPLGSPTFLTDHHKTLSVMMCMFTVPVLTASADISHNPSNCSIISLCSCRQSMQWVDNSCSMWMTRGKMRVR